MDETLEQQARLIRSQINILNITPVKYNEEPGSYSDKCYNVAKYVVHYEFPYRVKGERYWSKQLYTTKKGYIDAEVYRDICDKVANLRAILED